MKIEAYCDGACGQNTDRIGGYAAIIIYDGKRKEITGSAIKTTNNQMELMAVITAFRAINKLFNIPCEVTVTTDSEYVVKGITSWLPKWQKSGWRTAARKPVKNKELWMDLSKIIGRHRVNFQWTRGHADNKWNNKADELATSTVESRRKKENIDGKISIL
jgi:ribonuclease HI